MKVDLYTKSVLTVIAVALCAIAFQNVKVISEAQAAAQRSVARIKSIIRSCQVYLLRPPYENIQC